jgi:tetratricopeptide (TPR) repeat protein
MAQGEFALVRELLEKAIHEEKLTFIADLDLYAMLADVAVQQRDRDALREYAPLLEETATPLEHNLYLATAHRAWGVLHRLEGAYEEAETRLQQAVAVFGGLDTRWQLGRTHFELGQLAVDRYDTAEAKQQYARALALFEEMGAVPDAGRARKALSLLEN